MKFLAQLQNPPREFTAIPFWFLNGELTAEELRRQQTVSAGELSRLKMELNDSVGRSTERMAKVLTDNQRLMQEVTAEQLSRLDRRFASFAMENEQKLEQIVRQRLILRLPQAKEG